MDQSALYLNVINKGATSFVEQYYKIFDTNRGYIDGFYKESSAILWNGNPFGGIIPFKDFVQKLPVTRHTIQTYDCQPILGSDKSIMINVNGEVKYSDQTSKQFHQNFILMPDLEKQGTYYVAHDCFRFV
ncbi:NTF2-like protein [Neocallimastix lanati (nom. inval.)]|uniref:Nuclear transport factor 2 n=1 Tax=Neocallimastix californiae TaxID=1754190 RepID=A0A1Y2AKU6_9FUNG|nr:NTF2-like protein [Neocallimastix sp. JGI-2020a]ORY22920.1 NTF2-like protein [Neocallimastix californiae]|eukprot:ORY22920.1 NTF2-like protein [Neocallimastix californiae]